MDMATASPVADLPAKSIHDAKRQFAEVYGSALVLNTYLKIAVLLLLLLALGLLALNFRAQSKYANVKPLVIRIDDVGRAEAVSYDAAAKYQPQAPELRYFLTRFVVTYFSRQRATLQRDFPESLFFLEPSLFDSTVTGLNQGQVLETFVKNTAAEEIEVKVNNVTLSELSQRPYKAAVDFQQIYYAPGTRQERRRDTFVAQIDFVMLDTVPAEFVPVNPLGLQITNFRVDQAFR
jgi:type IV secretory pathway TrbF-like protein